MTNVALVLIYFAPISLYYNCFFPYDLLFINPDASIGFLEKKECLNFWCTHPLPFQKNYCCVKILEKLPSKITYFGVLNSSTFASLLGPLASRGSCTFQTPKESMPKKFQTCTEVCLCNRISHKANPQLFIFLFWI